MCTTYQCTIYTFVQCIIAIVIPEKERDNEAEETSEVIIGKNLLK